MALTPEQSRASRAWLDWTQSDLARRARVSISTVRDYERGSRTTHINNLNALQSAFERAGAVFVVATPGGYPGLVFTPPRPNGNGNGNGNGKSKAPVIAALIRV